MSERKPKMMFKTGNSASNAKTALQSAQKHTPFKQKRLKQEILPGRNLMPQFQRLKPTPSKPAKHQKEKQDSQRKSQINSSEISSQLETQSIIQINLKEEDYSFQLPRSYIIAMGGLQQAVSQRDNELKNLKISLQQESKIRSKLEKKLQEFVILHEQLEKRKIQLLAQVNLLKQLNIEEKRSQSNNEKAKNELQMQLALLKQKSTTQITQLKRQIELLELQKDRSHQQNVELKSLKKKNCEEIQGLKEKVIQSKEVSTQIKSSLENEVIRINKELQIQKEIRKQAEKEIIILKNQLSLLAQRAVVAERQHQHSLIAQKTFHESIQNRLSLRVPLIDISTKNKSQDSTSKYQIKQAEKMIQFKKDNEVSKLPYNSKKPTQNSFITRQRSRSRVKIPQNRPQIVSQYRELLRYQKESIALNYQLQLLQKSLAGQSSSEGRNQLQRSYQKLKRQCQQKQLQIRQLKCFLNEAAK